MIFRKRSKSKHMLQSSHKPKQKKKIEFTTIHIIVVESIIYQQDHSDAHMLS